MLYKSVTQSEEASAARRQLAKKARFDCYKKRMQDVSDLAGVEPTPGLVSGDFCSTNNKRPKTSVRGVVARKSLWNRCAQVELPDAVRVFNWAITNKRTGVSVAEAVQSIEQEKSLFDRVATAEGHRVLSFLDKSERLVLLKANPVFEESRFDLRTLNMKPELAAVYHQVADLVGVPFKDVVILLRGKSWIRPYLLVMKPERIALILEPFFLKETARTRLFITKLENSFSRWDLTYADIVYSVDYTEDTVDVEHFSASCHLAKSGIKPVKLALEAITSQMMRDPGSTWIDTTKAYVLRVRETRLMANEDWYTTEDKYIIKSSLCQCMNTAAKACVFSECGTCCSGPCRRHYGG